MPPVDSSVERIIASSARDERSAGRGKFRRESSRLHRRAPLTVGRAVDSAATLLADRCLSSIAPSLRAVDARRNTGANSNHAWHRDCSMMRMQEAPAITTAASRGSEIVDLGPPDAIPLGEGRAYCLAGRAVAVFRTREGALYALDNRCPHRGGALADGLVGDGAVICPVHARKFELATGRCANDATRVRCYPVFLVNGRMSLVIEES
jgi:nitrite reductase [NAD(P)H] small subunit